MYKKDAHIFKALLLLLFTLAGKGMFAQSPTDSVPKDPAALSVYTIQNMNFGAFTPGGSGGTISLSANGTRTSTGTVLPFNLGFTYAQAIFEIESPPGFIISILSSPTATLTGSNGGTMSLAIGPSDPIMPYSNSVPPPGRTLINIGGTLTMGNNTTVVPGSYTGTFYITFNQE